FESGGTVVSPPEPLTGELVQGPPEHRNVAITQDGELIGNAGPVAIEGRLLRGAGPERRRQVEVLLGVLVAGADVWGAPMPADRGDAALFEVPAGGAICDERPPLRIDVVQT